jgi:hypothetical protein
MELGYAKVTSYLDAGAAMNKKRIEIKTDEQEYSEEELA